MNYMSKRNVIVWCVCLSLFLCALLLGSCQTQTDESQTEVVSSTEEESAIEVDKETTGEKEAVSEGGEEVKEESGEKESSAVSSAVSDLAEKFGRRYEPIEVTVTPLIQPYTLPLKKESISNFEEVHSRLRPSDEALKVLFENGVAAMPYYYQEDFVEFYKMLRDMELPIYITADSVLHLYHIQFDESLKRIEETHFIPQLEALLRVIIQDLSSQMEAMAGSEGQSGTEAPGPEYLAREKALAFLSVAHTVLTEKTEEDVSEKVPSPVAAPAPFGVQPRTGSQQNASSSVSYTFPDTKDLYKDNSGRIAKMVKQEVSMIHARQGFQMSAIFNYKEDFTQYIPRGHYTRSAALKRYFKAMMYLGRMTFLIKGGEPYGAAAKYLVSEQEAKIQTMAAAALTRALLFVTVDNTPAEKVWERIYDVTAFYVGLSDDLTCKEYKTAIPGVGTDAFNLASLSDEDTFYTIKLALARLRKPAIYSGTGASETIAPSVLRGKPSPEELDNALDKTQGFRFMGQRFVPDSYAMGKLVAPSVNEYLGEGMPFTGAMVQGAIRRVFPRGLDVAALLGSSRAEDILEDSGDSNYRGYDKAYFTLETQFAAIDEAGWNMNLYWSWLYCLKPLLREFGAGYQTYMTTDAWKDKELAAALGSWSQLRHDTILYVKQSYTMKVGMAMPGEPKEVPGYVEPVPEFYARVLALTRLTRTVLTEMDVLDKQIADQIDRCDTIFSQLLDIAQKELTGVELTKEEYDFIKYFSDNLKAAVVSTDMDAQKSTLIADVHTDQNTESVLEEGTGYIGMLFAVNALPDGRLGLAVGPVFTYYEFKHPMSDRLTDEKWRELLRQERGAYDKTPGWIESYFKVTKKQ